MKAISWILSFAAIAGAWPFAADPNPDPVEKAESDAKMHYPADRFIVGIGESQTSFEDAEVHARAKISEQIDLSIQSTLTSLMKEDQKDKIRTFSSKVEWEERKETHFDNAQLIHCESPRKVQGRWLATAWLSRNEALGGLKQQYEDSAQLFRRRAREALASSSLERFTTPWREALRRGVWLKLQGVRFLSIAGIPLSPESMGANHPHAPFFPEDMTLLQRLDSARSHFMEGQRVSLKLDELPDFLSKAAQVLKDEGVPLGDQGNFALSIRWEKTASESAIGEIIHCRLTPILVLTRSSGLGLESSPVRDATGNGFVVRDEHAACVDAKSKVDLPPLEASLHELLRSAFPIL